MTNNLSQAIVLAEGQLFDLCSSSSLLQIFATSFGTIYNQQKVFQLQSDWQSNNFSNLPQIELISGDILSGAVGAYATTNNTIYLSDNWVNSASSDAISAVLLEEIGHSIDAQINLEDAAGDEGYIFSALTRGQILTVQELSDIQQENDWSNINLQGQSIPVEKSDYTSFYIHIKQIGNSIEYYQYVTPTFPFVLIDNSNNRISIDGFRSLYDGDAYGGQYYSEWKIDKISLSKPPDVPSYINYTDYVGKFNSIPVWYPVTIPSNFKPVNYIAGFGTYLPFNFSLNHSTLNTPVHRFSNKNIPGTHFYTASETERQNVIANYPQFNYDGIAFLVGVSPADDLIPVHRFSNQNIPGTHFYTASEVERQSVLQNYPQFNYDGIAYYVYDGSANLGADVYRFSNTSVPGTHFYTASQAEYQNIIANYPQFHLDGVAYEVSIL